MKVVKELLEHHIEEEETEMFPQAKKLWVKPPRRAGAQMEALKAQYKKEMTRATWRLDGAFCLGKAADTPAELASDGRQR